MSGEKEENGGFRVTDRRLFDQDGELRQDAKLEREPEPASPPPESAEVPPADSKTAMDFSSFLISLATTVMVHLGEIPDPEGGQSGQNLEAARQMIDILAILEQKTEGNRLPEESRLLTDLLYELRMKFLSKSKAIQL